MPEFNKGVEYIYGKNGHLRNVNIPDTDRAIRIYPEDDLSYATKFTDKKYVNVIDLGFSDEAADEAFAYIRDLFKDRYSLWLYNTWMGDESPLRTTTKEFDDFTVDDLKDLWRKDHFKNNECLKIVKQY